MIPSSFLSSQQFADAHLCKYYSIFFSFGLHLIYSVSEHKKPDYRLLFTHYCPAKQLFGYEQVAKRIANVRFTLQKGHLKIQVPHCIIYLEDDRKRVPVALCD